MEQIILDGKALSKQIEKELTKKVEDVKTKLPFTPKLATIIVGKDPASQTYVNMKRNACKRVGLDSTLVELKEDTTEEQLLTIIEMLNKNEKVCGILLQHPIPSHIDERKCFDSIALLKDVDGVNSKSYGAVAMGVDAFKCATPCGIITLLKNYNIDLEGKNAVIVGRSPILGLPLANLLLNENCTVKVCHSRTKDIQNQLKNADIVVGAVGKPNFIKADWVKDGVVLVDAGYNIDENGKSVGDIEKAAYEKSSAYTPVPGGVGPMTICSLISQTVVSAQKLAEKYKTKENEKQKTA